MSKLIIKHFYLFIVICGTVTLFSFLGNVHLFDWDEANFAEMAREMILTKNYLQPQINYLPFYEKPPIFIWLQVASMKLFGINEFAARFPNAVLGILVMISLYWMGKREHDSRFGRIWVLTYMGSFLPFMYFRTGLIDPWFNYFMFLSLYFYYNTFTTSLNKVFDNKLIGIILSALSLGLAVQTKGPAGFIIVFGTVGILWIITKFKTFPGILSTGLWVIFSLFFSSLWFLYETYQHGTGYMNEFIIYQIRLFTTEDALHGGPIYYHFIVLLLGCFPASFILLFSSNWKEKFKDDWFKIMCICGLLVLTLFSVVQTKIIHYSSMAYFPISYIAAISIYQNSIKKISLLNILLVFFISLLSLYLIFLPICGKNILALIPYIKDPQTKLQLGTVVNWHYLDTLFGLLIVCIFFYFRNRIKNSYLPFFISTSAIVLVLIIVFAPKIERYTQGTYIDFCKKLKGKDVDIVSLYMKSYGQFYYQDKQPFINEEDTFKHIHYLYNPIKRDVYLITKNNYINELKRWQFIEEKNGFVFFKREAKND